MSRRWILALVLVVLTARDARADACRKQCKATKQQCLQKTAQTFASARQACPATSPTRKPCVKVARMQRAAAAATCNATFRSCKGGCGRGGGGGGACGASGTGIDVINSYRRVGKLPAAAEDPTLSAADVKHAQYMVKNGEITHVEDPSKPGYTPDGAQAGLSSDVAAFSSADKQPKDIVEFLLSAPFHGIGILDPHLLTTGFGIAHGSGSKYQTAGCINVLSGLGQLPATVQYPVLFPADGSTLPLTLYPGNENPDPLTSCPGYAKPTGMPLFAQLTDTPAVTDHSLMRNGHPVAHCLFDGTSYTNPDPASQQLGRSVLAARNAIVIMPRSQLQPGDYRASITSGGQTTAWGFQVTCGQGVPQF